MIRTYYRIVGKGSMGDRSRKKKKNSIFRIFLMPLIVIMLVQSMITIGTLIVRRTAGMLQE